jgi:AcrR family transcriptional regulator
VELILDSTRELLREQGLTGFTTTAIAARAGIPVSSVYQYFPDKKAILVAIYTDYLGGILEVYNEFEDPKYDVMDREQVLDKLYRALLQAELRDSIEDALEHAIHAYPELAAVDREHRELTADILAPLLRRLGSRWRMPRLRRLVQFLYCVNNGIWTYRNEVQPPKQERIEWEIDLMHATINRCFD